MYTKRAKASLAKTWGTKILSTLRNNSIYREWAYAGKIAETLTLWRRNFFFLILVHPVNKMWTTQEPKKVALW